jgi:hypothetical protein
MDVLGLKLCPETGCPEMFRGFPKSLQTNYGTVHKIRLVPLPSIFFTIHYLSSYHQSLYSLSY